MYESHKNQNESRIRYLERMLKTADIVSDTSKDDEVGMDDIVEVEFEDDGGIEKYKLVTSIRSFQWKSNHRDHRAGPAAGRLPEHLFHGLSSRAPLEEPHRGPRALQRGPPHRGCRRLL